MSLLYFLAIVPPEPVFSEINLLKLEMAHRFNSRRALKSPPHLTLVPPFTMNDLNLKSLVEFIENGVKVREEFPIELRNFGSFENRKRRNPVIFVKPELSSSLWSLYDYVSTSLSDRFDFIKKDIRPFAPHMTIAFKDLSLEQYDKAWPEFKEKNYFNSFMVDKIYLLKNTPSIGWSITNEFPFKKKIDFDL